MGFPLFCFLKKFLTINADLTFFFYTLTKLIGLLNDMKRNNRTCHLENKSIKIDWR